MTPKTASPIRSRLTTVGKTELKTGIRGDSGPIRRCSIIVVHGLATATSQGEDGDDDEDDDYDEDDGDDKDAARAKEAAVARADAKADDEAEWPWQWQHSTSPASRVANFLSLQNTSSETLAFRYRLDLADPTGPARPTPTDPGRVSIEATQGLSSAMVRHLAIELLDALVNHLYSVGEDEKEEDASPEDDLVFVGQDFGGLVVKEALSLARWLPTYYRIAAATTVLVFYETPRPIRPGAASWESLANWLLFVSGHSQRFNIEWIQTTARMIEVVCHHFSRSEQLHHVIPVNCDAHNLSPTMGAALVTRGWLLSGADEASGIDAVIERVCSAIKETRPLGIRFIQLLQTLARVFRAPRRDRPLSDWKARASVDAVDSADAALNGYPGLKAWSSTVEFSGCFAVPLGDDAYPLFFTLQTSSPSAQDNGTATVIRYVFDLYSLNANSAESLLASLCYQILCSKPHLYKRLEAFCLEMDLVDGNLPSWRLIKLLQSLVSCPAAGQTVCVLWEMPRTEIPRETLAQLVSLAALPTSSFKLAMVCSRSADALAELPFSPTSCFHMPHREPDLKAILDNELNALLARRPDLAPVRTTLRETVLEQRASDRDDLFAGPWNTVKVAVRAWLSLIIRRAVPISTASLRRAIDSMPSTLDSLHASILQQTPPSARPLMKSILSWLALAQRPLQAVELATALAVEDSIQTIEALRENTPKVIQDDMLRFLGSAVRTDSGGYLLLQTELAAFLRKQQQQARDDASAVLPADAHFQLAQTCLAFLRLYKTHEIASLAKSISHHPFLAYAIQHWPFHYSRGKTQLTMTAKSTARPFLAFFEDNELILFWTRMRTILERPEKLEKASLSQDTVKAAVFEGCLDLVDCLLGQLTPESQTESQTDSLSRALLAAIQKGDSTAVARLLDANITSPYSLHFVAYFGHRDLLHYFVPTPENLREIGPEGFLPLHHACQRGALGIIDDFIRAGANVRAGGGPDMASPLHVACINGHTDVIRRLVQETAKNEDDKTPIFVVKDQHERTPLHMACVCQQPEAVRTLLDVCGGNDSLLYATTSKYQTALHIAAEAGRADIVNLLLRAETYTKATVDVAQLLSHQDTDGSTALHIAARHGHIDVVNVLLEHDADGSSALLKNNKENMPMHLATKYGHAVIVKRLLAVEPVWEQLRAEGYSDEQWYPIHLATRFGHTKVLRLLVDAYKKHDVSLDLFDSKQRAALHFAATRGHLESVRLLVEYGATVDIVTDTNTTPLWFACSNEMEDVASYLVDHKASISLGDDEDITPLLAAAWGGNIKIIENLVAFGADWSNKDSKGRNAVYYAIKSGYKETVAYVMRHIPLSEGTDLAPNMQSSESDERIVRGIRRTNTNTQQREREPEDAERDAEAATLQIFHDRASLLLSKDNDGKMAIEAAASSDLLKPLSVAVRDQPGNFDELHQKLLRDAAADGHLANVTYLVDEKKTSPDATDSNKRTALSYAAEFGHLDVVKFLAPISTNEPDNENRTPLFHAAIAGHMEVITYLISVSHDISDDISRADKNGLTPLYLAVTAENLDVVKLLLDKGANVNAVEANSGFTPLHYAAYTDNSGDFIRCLLDAKGVDGHAKDNLGRTPMYLAAYYGRELTVALLLNANWPANFGHGEYGDYPLHVSYDSEAILQLLIDRGGAEVNQTNLKGATTLHWALEYYAVNVPFLLEHGADPSLQDKDGDTGLHVAAKRQTPNLMKTLIEKSPSSLGVKNKNGYSVFLMAVESGNQSMVEYLLELDGKPFDPVGDRDKDGRTALEIALMNNEAETFKILLDAVVPVDNLDVLQKTMLLAVSHMSKIGKEFSDGLATTVEQLVEKLGGGVSQEESFALLDNKAMFDAAMCLDDRASMEIVQNFYKGTWDNLRDQHGWTWAQLSAALVEEEIVSSRDNAEPDGELLLPSAWTTEDKNATVRLATEDDFELDVKQDTKPVDEAGDEAGDGPGDGPDVEPDAKPDTKPARGSDLPTYVFEWKGSQYSRLSIMTNHPAPFGGRFYYSMRPLKTFESIVGAGVAFGDSNRERMPGWDDNTWGFHGDDGGFFHEYGSGLTHLTDYKYGVGDTLGVFIDARAKKVFFATNGQILPVGFHHVHGRVFPMVGVAGQSKVAVTLGSPPGTDPFKDAEGKEQMDKVMTWIPEEEPQEE